MPYKDPKRVADFYSKAFGWYMNEQDEEMGHYVLAQTTETDENQMVQTPGTINGGFYDLKQTPDSTQPSVVISVEDAKKSMEDIKAVGGEILGDPQDITGVGLWVSFRDSEGNRVSILQPTNSGG